MIRTALSRLSAFAHRLHRFLSGADVEALRGAYYVAGEERQRRMAAERERDELQARLAGQTVEMGPDMWMPGESRVSEGDEG